MKRTDFTRAALLAAVLAVGGQAALAAKHEPPKPLFPVTPLVADEARDTVYPSVAGKFLVYSQRRNHEFSVVRVSKHSPELGGREIVPAWPKEAIRFGVALEDGAIGYISNRMGPVAAWMRHAHGDGHVAIANTGTFTGALLPLNLHASLDGRIWCFDTSLEATRRSKMLNDFGDGFRHEELIGQTWRVHHSEFFRYKMGYHATEPGTDNAFHPPALFLFDRDTSRLTMIPDAQSGAVSPDGEHIVFVRDTGGNYDLWMQGVDGSELVQLTHTPFGEFEPAWSPDGSKLAFVSNRDSEGDVRATSVYVIDLESHAVTRVTNALEATDGGPAWKDDHTIIFHSNRDPEAPQAKAVDDWDLWQVDLDREVQ